MVLYLLMMLMFVMINVGSVTLWQFYHSYSYLNTILSWLLQTWPGPGVRGSDCLSQFLHFIWIFEWWIVTTVTVESGSASHNIELCFTVIPLPPNQLLECPATKKLRLRVECINVFCGVTLSVLTVLYFIAKLFNNWSKGWRADSLGWISSLSLSLRERERERAVAGMGF